MSMTNENMRIMLHEHEQLMKCIDSTSKVPYLSFDGDTFSPKWTTGLLLWLSTCTPISKPRGALQLNIKAIKIKEV